MQVPFFEAKRFYEDQKEDLDAAIKKVLESGNYLLGSEITQLELEMSQHLGLKSNHSFVGCHSGTDALKLSLLAASVGTGDEVITVSLTAIPTLSAISSVGATPVFVDIDPDNWLMDLSKVSHAISPKTKAIIAVHLYGNLVPIPKLRALLNELGRNDIVIIEDVAQAQGSTFEGQPAGTMGDFGAFSFYPTKNLPALGDAGGVCTRSEKNLSLLRALRNYGMKNSTDVNIKLAMNSRLDEIQSAVLRVRLKRLDSWNHKKNKLMDRYQEAFSGLPFSFQKLTLNTIPAWHLCVIALSDEKLRTPLIEYCKKNAIETRIHYSLPTHLQPAFSNASQSPLPVTEFLTKRIFTFPMNAMLTDGEQERVIKTIDSFF